MPEHRRNASLDLAFGRHAMQAQRILKRATNGLARIERSVGILEHDLYDAGQGLSIARLPARHDLPVQHDAAARRHLQAKYRKRERRLAATGFADEAEAFTALQFEIDAIDRTQQPPAAAEQATTNRKMNREILHAKDDIVARFSSAFMHDDGT
jgi:hypothetical protein